ncbi:MAG: hypothetical protein R3B59_08950 [Dehalococcoidia bacterium]
MTRTDRDPQQPRRRGGQPGNLNAFKDGRYSRRLGHAFRMAPPGDMRDHLFAVVATVVRLELGRLRRAPTTEERAAAIERAIRRVQRAGTTPNYRSARSPREVARMFHNAIDAALTADPEPLDAPSPASRERPENEGNE